MKQNFSYLSILNMNLKRDKKLGRIDFYIDTVRKPKGWSWYMYGNYCKSMILLKFREYGIEKNTQSFVKSSSEHGVIIRADLPQKITTLRVLHELLCGFIIPHPSTGTEEYYRDSQYLSVRTYFSSYERD